MRFIVLLTILLASMLTCSCHSRRPSIREDVDSTRVSKTDISTAVLATDEFLSAVTASLAAACDSIVVDFFPPAEPSARASPRRVLLARPRIEAKSDNLLIDNSGVAMQQTENLSDSTATERSYAQVPAQDRWQGLWTGLLALALVCIAVVYVRLPRG